MNRDRKLLLPELRSRSLFLSRRDALFAAAVLPLGCARAVSPPPRDRAIASCLLTPENVEGPFYLDDALVRSDLREDRPGLPLALEATLIDGTSCKPIAGAAVDLWHCDAAGTYSGFAEGGMHPPFPGGPNGGPLPGPRRFDPTRPPPHFDSDHPPPRPAPTSSARFLRGVQLSDVAGRVRFTTIYPGWYAGRAVHIHLRIRTDGALRGETYGGGHVAHTGQLFFPEERSDSVFTRAPYAPRAGQRTLQGEDGIFGRDGAGGMLTLAAAGDGFTAGTTIAIDPRATRVPVR